ncbi:CoA-acylating methylmalonate-semialdehyde dehydrogenase [Algisphaera agarilytica]|uniref:methylmalonate-semialdehyde dehydrogenase (CoA acylating) n=1 Tax=Algisphaera agarilytica TaxID=1385975 RepID=A0A7X0H4D1_9BACT|nr:CoA-acylating methylmalonate-semialdehyde dehydrogenase [Algisphaera agarilytica]MBB6428989.1 malonate-semialdehyde dehydrogenase (acetylating)/methylmalonate-semialdehyde dehydrogenase [Algisphaera agarilytica]
MPETPADVPVLIAGRWETLAADRHTSVFNPSTGHAIAQTPLGDTGLVDRAVAAAKAALPAWSETPAVERARVMFAYRQLVETHFDELAALVTREHGKTLAEARAEVQRGLEMVEFATSVPTMLMGQTFPQIANSVDGETNRHPVGVCVGITPYNFPNMVPLWMYPIAIACGNTFVLKPSEKVPLSAVRLAELLVEAGLPEGVFNLVHGDKAVVDALITHDDVNAISFVGSTAIAKYVYETGCAHGKRVQAAGGAKNHLIIMPDADLDQSVKALAASAYGCAGQRCMAGSVALAVGSVGDALVENLVDYAGSINAAPSDGNETAGMGPVISAEHKDRVASAIATAETEGADVALDGRGVESGDSFLLGPSVIDRVTTDMSAWKNEIFGPVLSVVRADTLDDALAIGKACPYGNGASIFTRSGYAARQFKRHFNAGMIGINVGVPAPMAWLPFTGWNQSFFGDLHIQGTEGVHFYTRQKMTLTRWFESAEESHADPVWKTK